MERRILLSLLVSLSAVLAVSHYVASLLGIYADLWWFDMAMHTVGGAVAGLFFLFIVGSIRGLSSLLYTKRGIYLVALAGALLVGIGWEIFEYIYDIAYATNYVRDTASDILMDAVGAIFVSYYVMHRRFITFPTH